MEKKKFTIEYEQKTPMGMSSSHSYKVTYETNSAYNAMKKFESEYKEYIGYDWMGNPKSAYQITGWDITKVDDIPVKRIFNEKKNKFEYFDGENKKRA